MQQRSVARSVTKQARQKLWWPLLMLLIAFGSVPHSASAAPAGFVEETAAGNRWLYPSAASAQVRELQVAAHDAWQQVTSELAIEQPSNLTIRIGRNPEEMQSLATHEGRLPTYASGVALPERSLIFLTLTAPETWELVDVHSVLTHEMSHVALHRAVHGRALPRWFVEGFAIDQAGERSLARVRTLWEGTIGGDLIPLSGLSDAFPAHHHGVNLAYAQSADFIRYLKRGPHGVLRLSRVIASVADGISFDDAVLEHYRAPLITLEREWREHLAQRFGQWPLVLSGLTGLWFLLAVLLVVAYVRTRRKHHDTLERWGKEEAAFDRMTDDTPLEDARSESEPPPPPPEAIEPPVLFTQDGHEVPRVRHDPSGIPTIQYGGENHTLH